MMLGRTINYRGLRNPVAAHRARRRSSPTQRLINALFSNGKQGVFYVPQPVVDGQQVLFTDAAVTTPVTADGDPVGRMQDLSGNDNNLTQPISVDRPLYRTDSSFNYLQLDGAGDNLRSTFAPAAPYTLAVAISLPPGSDYMYGFGSGYVAPAPGSGFGRNNAGQYFMQSRTDSNAVEFVRRAADSAPWVVVVRVNDDGNITIDDDLGSESRSTSLTNIQMTDGVSVGRPAQNSNSVLDMNGNFWGGLALNRFVSDSEVADIRSYLANLAGVTL